MSPTSLFNLVFFIIGTCLASSKEHYDIKLHYHPLQSAFLDDSGADFAQALLITELKNLTGIDQIELNIYDISVSGEELNKKTLIIHAELSLNGKIERDEFVRRLQKQKGEHPILVFYLRKIDHLSGITVRQYSFKHKLESDAKSTVGPEKTCENGGVLLPNSICSCDPYFEGDDCSILRCVNEGLAIESTRCVCPPGWVGRHCEVLPTLPSSLNSFDFSSRTLVLVLNNVISTTYDIQQALFAITQYFQSASTERKTYYKNFILYSFIESNEKYLDVLVESTNYEDFINEIASIIPLEGESKQPVLTATKTAITKLRTTLPKSTVLVIGDHLASDATADSNTETSTTLESSILRNALYWQHSINFILTERSNEVRPAIPDDSYKSLHRLSLRCNGELADLGKSKVNVKEAVNALLEAQFKSETIAARRDADFSKTIDVHLETSQNSLLYVSGKGFELTDVGGNVIKPQNNAGTFVLYLLTNSQKDLKLVPQQGASAKISYRAVIETDKQLFVAYTHNKLSDATSVYCISQIPHQVVLHAPDDFVFSNISGVRLDDYNVEVFSQVEMEVRKTDSNFPMIAKSTIKCTVGPFYTKIKYSGQEILMPNFCFDPDHHNPDDHSNSCNGNGSWNKDTKKCDCKKYFEGDNCEKVICENGGSVNDFPGNGKPICLCPDGTHGDHCEIMACTNTSEKPKFTAKSLSVVLQKSFSQAFLNPEVREAAKSALTMIEKDHPDYFSTLILTTFVKAMVGKDPEIKIQQFKKPADLLTALDLMNMKYAITTDDKQSSLEALLQTLQIKEVLDEQNRLILLFVDSPPKNTSLVEQIKNIALHKSIAFNIFVTSPYGLDGNGECMDLQYLELFKDLSRSTSGLFFSLCHTYTTGAVKNFLTGFLGASYRYQTARRQTSTDCKTNVAVKIGDGTDLRYFLIDADQSSNFDVTFQTSDGQKVEIEQTGKLDTAVLFKASKLEQKEYQLKVSTSTSTHCRITVAQESDVNLAVGFTPNPSLDAGTKTTIFATHLHPVVYLATQFQSTAKVELSVDDDSKYNEVAVMRSDNCTFEYYFLKSFACSSNPGPFNIQLTFTTEDGVYLERSISSYCEKATVQCLNGGTFKDKKCHCDTTKYTGDYCESPICKNGRMFEDGCECFRGYSGQFCEDLLCTSWDFIATHDTNKFEYQTIIFAVQNDQNAQDTNKQLITGIQQFVDKLSGMSKQTKHYSLLTFDDSDAENVINTVDTKEFVSTFIEQLNKPATSNKKKVRALYSMQLATKISVYQPTILYVFLNADTAIEDIIDVLETLSLGGQEINVIYTKSSGLSGGTSAYYKQITTSSNGRYIWTEPDNVQKLLIEYLPITVFENGLIIDELVIDCTKGVEFSFPVESRLKWFTVVARGLDVNKNIKVTDNTGNDLKPQVLASDQGGYVGVVDQSSVGGGVRKVSLKSSTGECTVQIRASSELHTEVGFTLDIHDDFPNERPTIVSAKNGSTFVSVKVGKSLMSTIDVLPSHVALYSRDLINGGDKLLNESNLISRDLKGCANQYISNFLDLPVADYKSDQTPLFVKITGKEGASDEFQRIRLYFPMPINCQNGAKSNDFGYCECSPAYTGDDCSIPRCQHDGIVDLTVCACKSGYHGDFCELSVS